MEMGAWAGRGDNCGGTLAGDLKCALELPGSPSSSLVPIACLEGEVGSAPDVTSMACSEAEVGSAPDVAPMVALMWHN
eukprot:4278-Pelagomonas_calceolata.AAC.5